VTAAPALPDSPFDLPPERDAKRDPRLIADDEAFFARLTAHLAASAERLERERAATLLRDEDAGEEAMERDREVRRLNAELSLLRRYGRDLCLGRAVAADGTITYIGRAGITGGDGERLLVDWRSPAAEPFFAATLRDPRGLVSRRRYRWHGDRIVDYWDEELVPGAGGASPALDDQSAFISGLGADRSSRMRDVLGTIQADQDAIIRSATSGTLVVDGGPGTGKTVVALHRTAYLMFADPGVRRRGVLVIGPSHRYLDYVADVLPDLGEEGVRMCTLRDLVPEGATAVAEADAETRRLKASGALEAAVLAAVAGYEQPPRHPVPVATPWGQTVVTASDWADLFAAPEPGATHNEARTQIWDELVDLVADRLEDPEPELLREVLRTGEVGRTFRRAWPLLDPVGVVADLLGFPDHLRRCAPALGDDAVAALTRTDPRAWTVADLPALDLARHRIGDPDRERVERRRRAQLAAQRETMSRVVDDLIAGDDSDLLLSTMLRGADAQESLIDDAGFAALPPDELAGPFSHVVVDEAQELTDAEWGMVLRRVPGRSLTVVGDRAQARDGFPESWEERLARVGLTRVALAPLSVNYRTPREVMAEAEPAIRAALPDANVPESIRSSGLPVRRIRPDEVAATLERWLAEHESGVACVIGDPGHPASPRVAVLTPESAKGLEFDLVVLVRPDAWGEGIAGAVDRYVAMTRSTRELVIAA